MHTRPLGRTDLIVSRLGIGLAALGRPGYINLGHAQDLTHNYDPIHMQQQTYIVLDAALAAGIRYFDVARSYGNAEQFLASWLDNRRIRPEQVVIGSKWGYVYTAGWQVEAEKHEVKYHTLDVLQRQLAESRTNLGKYLRLYQIHSATLDSGVLDNSGILDRLADLKQEGLKIGLSISGAKQAETLKKAISISRNGDRLFDTVQATWNMLEQTCGEMLHEAHEQGLGVIIKEALANGRLTQRNDDPVFHTTRETLKHHAARLRCSVDAFSLAAVLHRPWVDVVLSGAATLPQLQSNLTSLDVRWDDEAEALLTTLAESPETYWSKRSQLAWN